MVRGSAGTHNQVRWTTSGVPGDCQAQGAMSKYQNKILWLGY